MPLKVQHDEQPQLNLTPMIDVLFLLIIFFMVATTFGDLEQSVDLQVPEVTNAGDNQAPAQPLVINVFADGHLEFEGATVSIELPPELFEGPYFCRHEEARFFDWAGPAEGHPTVARFRALAQELGVVIPVSFFERVLR